MKTYKLNRDWAMFSEGELFKKGDDGCALYTLASNGNILAKIPADLLGEVGNDDHWKPKAHERYYFIDDAGDVDVDTFCSDTNYDNNRLAIGNCFRIEEDALEMVKWLKTRQRLIESGARFVNSSDVTVNDSKRFYTVYLTMNDTKLRVDDAYFSKDVVRDKVMCFDDRGVALKSIEEHRDDWLTYLGVGEEDGDD